MQNTQKRKYLVKKIADDVDKLSETEKERLYVITTVQKMLKEGFTYNDIAKETGISTRTVGRYRIGDPMTMCRQNMLGRTNSLDFMKDHIIELLNDGYHQCGIFQKLVSEGYSVHKSTVTQYVRKVAKEENLDLNKNRKGPCFKDKAKLTEKNLESLLVKRTELFDYLWMNKSLDEKYDFLQICSSYPVVLEIKKCINEFREIFHRKNMPLLYTFIENYSKLSILGLFEPPVRTLRATLPM